jgi:predicted HTH domain antitoxin
MSDITITIPQEIVSALRLPPDSVESALHQELAVALYIRGVLSSGKAATLAGLKRWQWEELLGLQKVSRHYTDEDLQMDIAYGLSD